MSKPLICLLVSIAIIFFNTSLACAGGLSTHFVEVKLDELELGKTYSINEKIGKPLVVVNATEDMTFDIEIEPEIPVDYNLVKGYEPIPDLSWVKIKKSYFKDVSPGKSAATDIELIIPNDKKHLGKRYQVYIYSHTAGAGAFRVGLMSRVLFNISAEKAKKGSSSGK